MGHRASGIGGGIDVDLVQPRDRRDPVVAELKVQALTQLHAAHVV
jgi:sulfonate transport system ATP-binding protein